MFFLSNIWKVHILSIDRTLLLGTCFKAFKIFFFKIEMPLLLYRRRIRSRSWPKTDWLRDIGSHNVCICRYTKYLGCFPFSKINLLKSTINTSAFYKQEYDLSDFLESFYVKFSYQSHARLITQKIRTLMSKTASKENEQQVNLVTRSLYKGRWFPG